MQGFLSRWAPVLLLLVVLAGLACLLAWGGLGAGSPAEQGDRVGGTQAVVAGPAAPSAADAQPDAALGDVWGEGRDDLSPNVQGAVACPLLLPTSASGLSYQKGLLTESWKAYSTKPCQEVARELLELLSAQGVNLLEAGTMDLSGEAWGCTVKSLQDEALTLTLVPEKLGQQRDADNRLCITVVRINQPSFI